jgi:hypothetical protein
MVIGWVMVAASIIWMSVEQRRDVRTRRAEERENEEICDLTCPTCGQKLGGAK